MAEHDVDIQSLFEPQNRSALESFIRLLHPADIAELFKFVAEDHWTEITALLQPETLAEVLAELDEGRREHLGKLMSVNRLIEAIEELETDDAADVIADLPDNKSEVVLEGLEDKEDITTLLAYDDDSAGGLMQTELCVVRQGRLVSDAIEAVRAAREEIDDIIEVYVVDEQNRFEGTLRLEDLVLASDDTPIANITAPAENGVLPSLDQEEVAQLFRKYDLATAPVVDEDGVLLGRITFDDVHDVVEEEASEDIMAMAGASMEELAYGPHVVRIAALRMPWLLTGMVGSLLTGFLLQLFAKVPGDALVMASFVPVVMAMTGNVGSQSAMIVTRGFATGLVEDGNIGTMFWREVTVGLLMGLTLGVLVGTTAHFFNGNTMLGVAVAASMVCSMSVASAVGVGAPTLFRRLGVDPAIAAGPLVTTGSDVLGVLIYLGVAIAVLG